MNVISWDGLSFPLPDHAQILTLDKGFIRIAVAERFSMELRYGPVDAAFNPERYNRRVCKAVKVHTDDLRLTADNFRPSGSASLYTSAHLLILHLHRERAVLSALFSAPPDKQFIADFLAHLHWTSAGLWRLWSFFDLAFEIPPGFALHSANFQPGKYRLEFTASRQRLVFERLAPANILLQCDSMLAWSEHYLQKFFGAGYEISSSSEEEFEAVRKTRFLARLFPWRTHRNHVLLRHERHANKILICALTDSSDTLQIMQRIGSSYVTTSN